MFTENEIQSLLNHPGVFDKVTKLKKEFVDEEAEFLEIEEHDFLSLILFKACIVYIIFKSFAPLFQCL